MTSMSVATNWIEVGRLEDIPRLGSRVVRGPDGNIAVFRTANDNVFALDDRCPHRGGPLSQGIVFGERVACPLHDWVIELKTGEAIAPDVGCAPSYPVKLQAGVVWLCLTRSIPAATAATSCLHP